MVRQSRGVGLVGRAVGSGLVENVAAQEGIEGRELGRGAKLEAAAFGGHVGRYVHGAAQSGRGRNVASGSEAAEGAQCCGAAREVLQQSVFAS